MCPHIIAIDAGGSKTKAVIKNTETLQTFELNAGGASLSHDLSRACLTINKLAEQLVAKADVALSDCVLVCGAAGAGCENNVETLSSYLSSDFLGKLITTDAQTSLYGVGKGTPIIVVAVGTGSVAMKLDEKGQETMIGGWGFIAGDLGSGAEIGRQIVTRVLVEFDKDNSEFDPIINEVINLIGDQRQSILDWLKAASASDYAKLAPVAFAGYMRSKIAKETIHAAAKDIEELVDSFSNDQHLPVAIIGGLSNQIKLHLSEKLQQRLIEPKGHAVDGALYLGEQILKQKYIEQNC
jgi:glucosamine kinase